VSHGFIITCRAQSCTAHSSDLQPHRIVHFSQTEAPQFLQLHGRIFALNDCLHTKHSCPGSDIFGGLKKSMTRREGIVERSKRSFVILPPIHFGSLHCNPHKLLCLTYEYALQNFFASLSVLNSKLEYRIRLLRSL